MFAVLFVRFDQAADGEVVRFGAAGGENDLVRTCIDQLSNLMASFVEGGPGFLTLKVNARRIAVKFRKIREHRFNDGRVGCGRSTVVEINASKHK